MELHLGHGVKSGKMAGISVRAVGLFREDTEVAFSVGFDVCVRSAVAVSSFEALTGASGSKLFITAGIVVNTIELLELGRDNELDVVDTAFDTEVGCASSDLLTKLEAITGVSELIAVVLVAETVIGRVHVARACVKL